METAALIGGRREELPARFILFELADGNHRPVEGEHREVCRRERGGPQTDLSPRDGFSVGVLQPARDRTDRHRIELENSNVERFEFVARESNYAIDGSLLIAIGCHHEPQWSAAWEVAELELS